MHGRQTARRAASPEGEGARSGDSEGGRPPRIHRFPAMGPCLRMDLFGCRLVEQSKESCRVLLEIRDAALAAEAHEPVRLARLAADNVQAFALGVVFQPLSRHEAG